MKSQDSKPINSKDTDKEKTSSTKVLKKLKPSSKDEEFDSQSSDEPYDPNSPQSSVNSGEESNVSDSEDDSEHNSDQESSMSESDQDEPKKKPKKKSPKRKLEIEDEIEDFTSSQELEKKEKKRKKINEEKEAEKEKKHLKNFESLKNPMMDLTKGDTSRSSIEIDDSIAKFLKPHQFEGIGFMWDHLIAGDDKKKGCILAHSMGLGKTLQVVTFCYMAHTVTQEAQAILIICPKSVIDNWKNEFTMWLRKRCELKKTPPVHVLNDEVKTIDKKLVLMKAWKREKGIMIMSFTTFLTFAKPSKAIKDDNKKRDYEKCKEISLTPEVVFVDEGHKIKNHKSHLYAALMEIKTRARCILTGTPLQNNLKEYWAMSNFVLPEFSDEREFTTFYSTPISNGQAKDAIVSEIRLMKRRSFLLNEEMKVYVHRRDQSILLQDLPPKHEYVLYIGLNDFQKDLYRSFLKTFENSQQKPNILFFATLLGKIVNHPDLIRDYVKNNGKLDNDIKQALSQGNDDEEVVINEQETTLDVKNTSWAKAVLDSDYKENLLENCPKMAMCFQLIESCLAQNEKVLVFSQFTATLDKMEALLTKYKIGGAHLRKDVDYVRLDGSVSLSNRETSIKAFNKVESKKRVFFISTKAGGLGINLATSSRVILYDVCWNPSDDTQSIFRAYRYGQKKPVFVYRLVGAATVEENIWKRCISKNWLFQRVVDEKSPTRILRREDFDLFEFESHQAQVWPPLDAQVIKDDDLLIKIKKDNVNQILLHESLYAEDLNDKISVEEQNEARQEKVSQKNQKEIMITNRNIDLNKMLSMGSQKGPSNYSGVMKMSQPVQKILPNKKSEYYGTQGQSGYTSFTIQKNVSSTPTQVPQHINSLYNVISPPTTTTQIPQTVSIPSDAVVSKKPGKKRDDILGELARFHNQGKRSPSPSNPTPQNFNTPSIMQKTTPTGRGSQKEMPIVIDDE